MRGDEIYKNHFCVWKGLSGLLIPVIKSPSFVLLTPQNPKVDFFKETFVFFQRRDSSNKKALFFFIFGSSLMNYSGLFWRCHGDCDAQSSSGLLCQSGRQSFHQSQMRSDKARRRSRRSRRRSRRRSQTADPLCSTGDPGW